MVDLVGDFDTTNLRDVTPDFLFRRIFRSIHQDVRLHQYNDISLAESSMSTIWKRA